MIKKRLKPTEIQKVKEAVDIKDVIGKVVELKRAGGYHRGCCPFHNEKSPSFIVFQKGSYSKVPNSYHCYGGQCGVNGDVIDFVQNYYNLTFLESVEFLAAEFQIPLQYEEIALTPEEIRKDRLQKLNDKIVVALHENLLSQPTTSDVRKYLSDRGLTDEDIKKWSIGFGTDQFVKESFLNKDFLGSQVSFTDFRDLDIDRPYFFSNRIIFPIFDFHGHAVGFSNRIFSYNEDKEIAKQHEKDLMNNYGGKYINTSVRHQGYDNNMLGSILFEHKSSHLYGLNKARQHLRRSGGVLILVEGFMDVISCHRNGIENSAGLMSVSFNDEVINLLKKSHVRKIIFCLDGDAGGTGGAERIVKSIQKGIIDTKAFEISIATLPDNPMINDPDSYLLRGSADGLKSVISDSQCISEFLIDRRLLKTSFESLSDKIQFVDSVTKDLETVRKLSSLERKLTIDSLSSKLNVPREVVSEHLDGSKPMATHPPSSKVSESIVISELIADEEQRAEILNIVSSDDYFFVQNKILHEFVEKLERDNVPIDFNVIRIKGKEDGIEGRYYDNAYLDELQLVPRANVHFHANKIVEYSKQRKLLVFGHQIRDSVEGSSDIQSVIGEVSKELYKISFAKEVEVFREPKDEAHDYLLEVERRIANPGINHGLYTGFPELDASTQGLFPGQVMLILARTSDGKTALAQNIVSNISLKPANPIPVYYANLEMPSQQMMDRVMSIYTGIPAKKITSGMLDHEKRHFLRAAISNYGMKNTLHIQHLTELNVSQLSSILRYQVERNKIKLAVVDYVQLMSVEKEYMNMGTSDQLGMISKGITSLAKQLKIPIIIIAQANRDTVTNNAGRPELQHIFGSDKFAHDVDIAVSLQAKTLKQMEGDDWLTPEEMIERGYPIRDHTGNINKDFYDKMKVHRKGNYWLHILKNRIGQKDWKISLFFHRFRITFEEALKYAPSSNNDA